MSAEDKIHIYHKQEFSWKKYGFTKAKRKATQAQQTVNCVKATCDHSWESPEGVLYSPQSDGPHRNHKSSVKISFCLVLKAAEEVNTTQLRTQGLSFQFFNFCASSCTTQFLHSNRQPLLHNCLFIFRLLRYMFYRANQLPLHLSSKPSVHKLQ